jgi:hypothetical protein
VIGFIEYLGRHFFAPRYFGRRYFGLPVPIDVRHRVFVLPAIRVATVLAAPAAVAVTANLVTVAPAVRLVRAED